MVKFNSLLLLGCSVSAAVVRRSSATDVISSLETVGTSLQNWTIAFLTTGMEDTINVANNFETVLQQQPQPDNDTLSLADTQAVVTYLQKTFIPTIIEFVNSLAESSADDAVWVDGSNGVCAMVDILEHVENSWNGYYSGILGILSLDNTLNSFEVYIFVRVFSEAGDTFSGNTYPIEACAPFLRQS